MSASDDSQCGAANNNNSLFHLRVASVFIVLVTSSSAALLPVLAQRSSFLRVPALAFSFAKYFGSGVIIATGFIHLLAPAIEELGSECLTGVWQEYPWALAISMFGVFCIFSVELLAFRWGTAHLRALGIGHDPHGHADVGGSHAAHGPEPDRTPSPDPSVQPISHLATSDIEKNLAVQFKNEASQGGHHHHHNYPRVADHVLAQIVGVAILEFGVVLHSFLIGLTLAVDPRFKILFIVIVFHQMFEGLGLGTRLASLDLPPRFRFAPLAGATLYGLTTPIGIAIGLGVRSTYNPGSATASIISGVMDALSSGILLYTGLVELLAHEFLFNPTMNHASTRQLTFALCSVLFGAGIMSLLGRWA